MIEDCRVTCENLSYNLQKLSFNFNLQSLGGWSSGNPHHRGNEFRYEAKTTFRASVFRAVSTENAILDVRMFCPSCQSSCLLPNFKSGSLRGYHWRWPGEVRRWRWRWRWH